MSDEQNPTDGVNESRSGRLQALVILAALGVAVFVVMAPAASDSAISSHPPPDSTTVPAPRPAAFDMLSYLNQRVASQEDTKDVRCWSSFCKLQMFLTGAAFDDDALGVRIEEHMNLIQSIWDDAQAESSGDRIGRSMVAALLQRRFPYQYDESAGATFTLDNEFPLISIDPDSLQDYGDTIEPWRLMQTWASRHTNAAGKLQLEPQFDEQALGELYGFLRTYDLAILRHARQIAEANQLSRIDAESMSKAFSLELKLLK